MNTKINVPQVKDRIINLILAKGPQINIKLAKEVGLSTMFASAILSELSNEKRVKISHLKIGSSPLYFISGQEARLELFSDNLTGIEKETFLKLKEKGILFDEQLDPATRVALRSIKDFAVPLKFKEKLIWRYFKLSNKEVEDNLLKGESIWKKMFDKPAIKSVRVPEIISQKEVGQRLWADIEKDKDKTEETEMINKIATEIGEKQKELTEEREKNIEELYREPIEEPKEEKKEEKIGKKKKEKPENIFFNEIKNYLEERSLEIIRIEKLDKKELFAKIQDKKGGEKPLVLMAFNKKKINLQDITKANKKLASFGLPYFILLKGDLTKKVKEEIETCKKIGFIGEIK